MSRGSGFWREPLVHFLVLGGLLFAAYALFHRGSGPEAGEIRVTRGQIEALAASYAKTWQRPPSREELDDLIEAYVREEIYCREAWALGLDRDDALVRRRLHQKMEFLSGDSGDVQPTDGDLRTYLAAHSGDYEVDGRAATLEAVKDRLRLDWTNARRLEAADAAYARLKAKYTVRIERP